MKIGVLALQGDFAEHIVMLKRLGAQGVEVRLPKQLDGLDGLIIPGGESTTIGKLADDFGLMEPLREFGKSHAIWGTCAGAIFLSKDVSRHQPLLGLMDIKVPRNAFGRQVDSFEADLDIAELKQATGTTHPYHAVFIRAPIIEVGAAAKPKYSHTWRWPHRGRAGRPICWRPPSILNSPTTLASTNTFFAGIVSCEHATPQP